jgi:uncharacterized protein YndB with AHSA1/START domain
MTVDTAPNAGKRKITLERTYRAPVEDVWELWTTKEGFESWWGPIGFTVTVQTLELRVGGRLFYVMTATSPEQVAFMKRAGMPLANEGRITFTEITPQRRLAYTHVADFIPGVAPYDIETVVDLFPNGDSVRMVLTVDAMHDDVWTERAVMGWKGQLTKLDAVFQK